VRKFLLLVFSLLFGCAFITSCTHPAESNTGATVVTSIFPVYDIVKNIAGDRTTVVYVVPVGANPHLYEPVPAEVTRLQNADLFIGVQRDFDGWVTDLLPAHARIHFLCGEEKGYEQQENPHIWLSPRGAKQIASSAARFLSSAYPHNSEYYDRNLTLYLEELSELDSTLHRLFAQVASREFIQWHPAWDHLARDYGLSIIATIEAHGNEPSVKEFQQLVLKAKSQNVRVVVTGLNAHSKATEALVREINATLIRLDTIGDPADTSKATYLKMMHHNAILLSDALSAAR
jgi:ABC-type Zn uptake system ZnuABC Zn-binding protein ZnuA